MQGTMELGIRWARALPVALILAAIIISDQVTKHLIRSNLSLGESFPDSWPARFTYVENTGSAFGLFTDQTIFLIGASTVAIAILVYLFRRIGSSSFLLRASLALQLGGGSSNLVDRIRFGQVTDFVDLRVWPIFNIADSSVVIGIVILAYAILFLDKKLKAGL